MKLALCGAALTLLASAAFGDEARASITLADAVALALQHNTDLRSSTQDVVSAHGAVVQAGALANPDLLVSSYGTAVSPLGAPKPTQVGVSWTVPIGGKRGAAISAAQAGLQAAQATQAAVRQQISLNAATAFVNLLLAQALLEFALQDQAGFRETLQLNEIRYRDGKIAFGDVLKLRVQALAEDDAARQAQQNLVSARADLQQLLGEGAVTADFRVQGALEPTPQVAETTPEALLAEALKKRPDYLALEAQTQSASFALSLARRQPIPDLGITVDYNHASGLPDSYDILASVPVPLFDRNTGNIEQAAAALEKARIAKEALRTQLRDAAIKAVAEWQSGSAQAAAYQKGVSDAEESLQISKHAYEQGQGSLLDFLSAQTSYRQVEGSFRSALARTLLAAYTLRFVAAEEIK